MIFLNPFKKYGVDDFPDVYVPLSEAPTSSSIVAAEIKQRTSLGTPSKNEVEDVLDKTESKEASIIDGQLTIEMLRAEVETAISSNGHDSAYDRKSTVINKAIQDIGMGSYQWRLFVLCGFGWFVDNLWLQGVALTLPSLSEEFGISQDNVRYTTLSLFAGLTVGAFFWGAASDIVGRRPAFNLTLLIAAVFGTAVGGAKTWIGVCGLNAALGCGVGGNLPVDGALFLEFLPNASGNLLTMLSVWWPFGQLLGSLIAWGFIPDYSVHDGWRYMNYTMGAITLFMFVCRCFLFHLFESPKFLLSRGRQREAVAVVRGIAHCNGAKTWLSEEILNEIGGHPDEVPDQILSRMEIIKRAAGRFSSKQFGPLFANKRLGINTALIWFAWATIGMGYPLFNAFLPQYLTSIDPNAPPTPTSVVYRNYAIESIIGCPGSIIACYTVNIKHIGRKGTMALATLITGIFLFLFTMSAEPNYQLAFSCLVAFFQNIMYGVLYAYTPEVFPAPNRGTGTGIASFFNRIAGLCAPLVALHAGKTNPKSPIYASGGLILAAFLAIVALPIETRGKQRL